MPALLTLLSKLLDIDQELLSFHAELETKYCEGPLYWQEGDDETLTFPSPRIASLLTLYWSIQTLSSRTCWPVVGLSIICPPPR